MNNFKSDTHHNIIKTKKDLNEFLESDRIALGRKKHFLNIVFFDDIYKFLIILRKHEYYINTNNTIMRKIYGFRHNQLSKKLSFNISCNTFGKGLRINHYGYLAVNSHSVIGDNCNIHQGVTIGNNAVDDKAPHLGNNVLIGAGAVLYGDIFIADNIRVGANSVVNKSFYEEGITICGVPAVKVEKKN